MQRIVVTGGECTGTTTLARELADWLHAPVLPEAARAYAESVQRPLTADDVAPIARRHIAQEDALVRRLAPDLVVLDTDLVSTVVYARHYYGPCPDWVHDEALARRGDLYLLGAPDLPWVPDGVRDRPDARREIQALFIEELRRVRANVIEVWDRGPRRLENAVAAVRGWRAAHAP